MLKKVFTIALLILTILINGCWDRRELESLGLIQALGLDMGPGGKGLTVTAMIAIPPKLGSGGGQSGGGGGGAETGVFTISMTAPTFYEAFNRLNTTINREITLIQNSTILIGEDLAKSGVGKWADTFVRFREMRRTVLLFVTKGTAADIMKVQPKLEKNPSEYFVDLAKLSGINGMFPSTTVNDFINCFEAYAQEIYIPLIDKYQPEEPGSAKKGADSGTGGPNSAEKTDSGKGSEPKTENIKIVGTAVFKKDKMVGSLNNYESQDFMLLNGKFREAMLSLPDPDSPGDYIVFRLLAVSGPEIKYSHREDQDFFSVKFHLEADIVSIQSGQNYTVPDQEKFLSKLIAQSLKRRIDKTIAKVQQQYQSDIFGFGIKVRSTFITSTSWNKYHWPDKFPSSKINVSVKVALRRVGVQFQPPEMR